MILRFLSSLGRGDQNEMISGGGLYILSLQSGCALGSPNNWQFYPPYGHDTMNGRHHPSSVKSTKPELKQRLPYLNLLASKSTRSVKRRIDRWLYRSWHFCGRLRLVHHSTMYAPVPACSALSHRLCCKCETTMIWSANQVEVEENRRSVLIREGVTLRKHLCCLQVTSTWQVTNWRRKKPNKRKSSSSDEQSRLVIDCPHFECLVAQSW